MLAPIKDFLRHETSSGVLLIIAAAIAMVMANSSAAGLYNQLIDMPVSVGAGALSLTKPLLLWINDGLMAVFFFVVGLELKREILEGELSDRRKIALPAFGALGGMLVPACIYVAINMGDAGAMTGWAVPVATDIAFALGILLLLGPRVPVALKVFLVSLAIFDDIGAIAIIAAFYASDLSATAMLVATLCLGVLFALSRRGVSLIWVYLLIGLVMWVALLKSGVHATLAGVLLAVFIPLRHPQRPDDSPLRDLEHKLHGVVSFVVLPVFAFANSGLSLQGIGMQELMHPVPLGIALGLFIGKQLGVFAFCRAAVYFGVARLPDGVSWTSLYGVALLCGVGYTMSLFIGSLAFEGGGVNLLFDERLGIMVGSLLSAFAGFAVLHTCLPVAGERKPRTAK